MRPKPRTNLQRDQMLPTLCSYRWNIFSWKWLRKYSRQGQGQKCR